MYSASAVIDMLSFEASLFDSNGDPINGNITVEIYDAATGGNLIYNSSNDFIDNITSGKVDLILGGSTASQELNLTYGTTYYMDLNVNGNDIDYNGLERQEFQSTVGNVTETRLNISGTVETHAIIPAADQTFDLGSAARYFQNLYINTINLLTRITNAQIASNAINTTQIIDRTIIADDIADNTINTTNILDATITEDDIAAGNLTSTVIKDDYLFNTGDTASGDYTFDSPTLHIDSGNNRVGIVTTTPANPLNVIGDGNFTGALYVGGVQITADSNVSGGGTSNYVVKFVGATTIGNSLVYDDGTLVGIDTTSPQGKLHIDNSTTLNVPWINVTD